jgi:hypothetical protein
MSRAGLRDAMKTSSPPWLQTGTAEKFMYTMGLSQDVLLEKLNQAMQAHMPGKGTATALPYVGADRLIPQGILEPATSYAARLQQAFESWAQAGSNRGVMTQILGYLTPFAPQTRCVSDPRNAPSSPMNAWYTYLAGTSFAKGAVWPNYALVPQNWNWDGQQLPWRFFVILFSVAPQNFTAGEGTWGDGAVWGDTSASWGLSIPAAEISAIRNQVIGTFKSAQWCQWIVISFDNSLFDPGATADGTHNPNGTWGSWGTLVNGVWVPSRPASGRYCSGIA